LPTSAAIPEQGSVPPVPRGQEELHSAAFEWLTELWRFRELLYFLAWRDVKLRYKQAALGAAWAIIQPLFTMVIFTLFFGKLAGVPSNGIPYPIFTYCALVPWIYFSSTLSLAGNSLVSNSNLITKVYFPRVLLPAASAVSGLLDFAVGSGLLIVLMLYYRIRPSSALLFYPVCVVLMLILTVGVSMFMAALNVRYRDVKHTIPFLVQIWLFVTPVIYPSTMIPQRYRPLLALNPMSGVVEGFRACLFPGQKLDASLMTTSLAVSLVFLIVAAVYFRSTERTFADII
jgi:lipopolysaccharide transport system permease protein